MFIRVLQQLQGDLERTHELCFPITQASSSLNPVPLIFSVCHSHIYDAAGMGYLHLP